MNRITALLAVAGAVLSACEDAERAHDPFAPNASFRSASGLGSRIVFSSDRDGDFEIYVMNADGSGVARLTKDPAVDAVPAPSPDGTKIAFSSDRDGDFEIYVGHAHGFGARRLTKDPAHDVEPAWSPDGTTIAFRSTRGGNNGDIYVMNVRGSGVTRLTNLPVALNPAWSLDGTKIAFESTARQGGPPLAEEAAFVSPLELEPHLSTESDIYVMNPDGSGITNLTSNPAGDAEPAWSPDGTKIAFRSDRDGNPDIYVMNADGSGVTRLTDDRGPDAEPAWSPDGTKIVFRSRRDGNLDIYVMNADGSGVTRLTYDAAQDFSPAWLLGK